MIKCICPISSGWELHANGKTVLEGANIGTHYGARAA
jgi:hypothetical protein